jgi:hypothetical protein
VIGIRVTPDSLLCGRPTDVVIAVTNRSPGHAALSVVVEFEPDGIIRLDRGDCRIEIDELGPNATHEHRVTLTGRAEGIGHVEVPYLSYLAADGSATSGSGDPMPVRVDPDPTPEPPADVGGTPVLDEAPPLPSAFISHRRVDSDWLAEHLRGRLAALLKGSRLFLDHADLAPGIVWSARIDRELQRASALIALIGPRWETVTDDAGVRRLCLPSDVVRHEIATALVRRILVIPVLHGRTRMPDPDDVPPDLRRMFDHNAVTLDPPTQRYTIRRITVELRRAGLC